MCFGFATVGQKRHDCLKQERAEEKFVSRRHIRVRPADPAENIKKSIVCRMIFPDQARKRQRLIRQRSQVFYRADVGSIRAEKIHMKNVCLRAHAVAGRSGDRVKHGRRNKKYVSGLNFIGVQVDLIRARAGSNKSKLRFIMPVRRDGRVKL